jgi:crotonobetainyl-CoA:carnitine CoA-transferase CaiB-like acyl-CoA transferase
VSPTAGLGIRVLDLAAGPGLFCTRLLVGLGADVIRVEPPGGDPMRADALAFAHWHAGKRTVELDLETAEGRAGLRRLCEAADVLVETLPRGALEDLELDPASLAARRRVHHAVRPDGPRAGGAAPT